MQLTGFVCIYNVFQVMLNLKVFMLLISMQHDPAFSTMTFYDRDDSVLTKFHCSTYLK